MNVCPITYEPCGDKKYSAKGLKLLSSTLEDLNDLSLTQEEQLKEAASRAVKMSIQGVQPKLSARLKVKEKMFEIVDRYGEYILKPQSNFYPEVPENEALTMRLAHIAGIEIPLYGLVYSIDGRFTYFIKRFDRYGKKNKRSLEDFAQLAGKSRETKYDFSMENVATILDEYCTFPVIEKIKLFRLTLFNFLIGNEDMHLKNFSLITRNNRVELSPGYDLINTTIALPNAQEEIALPLAGKKRNLNSKVLVNYWGKESLGLNDVVINQIISAFTKVQDEWESFIHISFLSMKMKERYLELLNSRRERLKLESVGF
jgi:serine/threonine-protein kinase HipA